MMSWWHVLTVFNRILFITSFCALIFSGVLWLVSRFGFVSMERFKRARFQKSINLASNMLMWVGISTGIYSVVLWLRPNADEFDALDAFVLLNLLASTLVGQFRGKPKAVAEYSRLLGSTAAVYVPIPAHDADIGGIQCQGKMYLAITRGDIDLQPGDTTRIIDYQNNGHRGDRVFVVERVNSVTLCRED